jgi:myo-inositol-1(or 4)-monophosphatase
MSRSALLSAAKLRRIRKGVASAVAEVAGMARRAQRRLRPEAIQRKGVGDFVTEVDLRGERQLRKVLGKLLPEAGFLGEESGAEDLSRDLLWVVDTIDGTSNFAAGLPHWAVSVALLDRGEPLLASIHSQPEGSLYEAVAGCGSFAAGRRFRCAEGRWDDGSIVGVQWHRAQQDLRFVASLTRNGGRVRTMGSTVTQMLDVARGRLDANVQQQGRLWDYAAAALVLLEAGGKLTDWRGRKVFRKDRVESAHLGTVATGGRIHGRVLQALRGMPDGNPPRPS